MTDDELDLLASAYLDGEATPDEVALVERDPDLQARVAELRAVDLSGGVTPSVPNALKEAHLAAALQAFDQELAVRQESSDAIATAASARPAPSPESVERPRRWWQTMPAWLPAAAVFVIVGGGLFLAVSQDGDSEESATETALDAVDDSAESDFDDASSDDAATEAMSAADEEDFAAFDAAGDTDAASEAEEQAALGLDPESDEDVDRRTGEDGELVDGDSADSSDAAESAVAPGGPPVELTTIPTSLDGLDLPELRDPFDSPCLESVAGEGIIVEGFVEAIFGDELVELWVVQRGLDSEPQPVVITADCFTLEP
jgi:hypothetical protein